MPKGWRGWARCGRFGAQALQFGFEFVWSEQAESLGTVREVRVEAVDERFALAAVEDLHIFEADEFVEAGAEAFVGPTEALS